MLESLQVQADQNIVIRILERALPSDIRQKWEESLSLDTLPDLNRFYKFINEMVFRLGAVERDHARMNEAGCKRRTEQPSYAAKIQRSKSGSRAFITSTSSACAKCNANHALYKCSAFEKLTLQQRWNLVKAKHLCVNCLHRHTGACSSARHCKHCPKFHHTLLLENIP